MQALQQIKQKLEGFLRKYYVNELIKGAILFTAAGLLYFIFTVLLEYFIWFGTTGRLLLFWLFVAVELFLFVKFIVIPLLYLFKIRKGIDQKAASQIIGQHFPQVGDKLLNLLQLSENKEKSELLMAGIEQKGTDLRPIPFQRAINLKANLKYVWYAAVPILIILIVIFLDKKDLFSDSYKRVVNYKTAYTPPAPFEFFVLNDSLDAIENRPFTLNVKTAGNIIPENVQILIDGEVYFMQQKEIGHFEYVFTQPKETVSFSLKANEVASPTYQLQIIETPSLLGFEMMMDYPTYTGKKTELLKNTGNAVIPEGTQVSWKLATLKTDRVTLQSKDTVLEFSKNDNEFQLEKRIFSTLDYSISTSNKNLKDYEKLGFSIEVTKDQSPEIRVAEKLDSTSNRKIYLGQLSDDYGIKDLKLVYYPEGTDSLQQISIPINPGNYDRFVYEFPGDLPLQAGIPYEFYFEVTDNDGIRGGKSAKSPVFNFRKLTEEERKNQQLEQQSESIRDMEESMQKLQKQEEDLEKISETNKQKQQLGFNDQKRIENFLERQQQQDEMMKRFHKELEDNLDEFREENKERSEFNELLKERLERQQREMEKNEKLMEELKELSDKIDKEKLTKKLEELAKQQKKDNRNLEQILELTKRYYTEAKAEKIKKDLEELAQKQAAQAEKNPKENTPEDQEELNADFKELRKDINALEKQNEELLKPMDLGTDEEMEQQIEKDQQEAKEKLEENKQSENQKPENGAQQKQRNAAGKMKQMAQNMQQQMQADGQQSMQEDIETLRQILDNLIIFSFEQEDIMKKLDQFDERNPELASYLRKQNDLRSLFEHIDDSLFALSLRQPKISEHINENITDVFYNIDKTLEQFAENRFYQGLSHQQYTLTASNELADFLSDLLDNMQQSLASGSQGGGQGFQLPDIIQSQEQLNQQMQEGMKKGEKPSEGKEGEKGEGKQPVDKLNENMSEELFEIYKQQQQLRNALEKQLENMDGNAEKRQAAQLSKQMEQIENQLLEKGFDENVLSKMMNLKHELLKLEEASFEQGQKKERESRTSTKEFQNKTIKQSPDIQQYFQEVEILNRQVLPLRQNYKQKVNAYFKEDD